jgi:hypothetical protein
MKIRVAWRALPAIALSCFLFGCSDDSSVVSSSETAKPSTLIPEIGPAITASPNPVPAAGGVNGTTTIAWNTGGEVGEVYLIGNGTDDRLFARGDKGSEPAPWITAGVTYEFRLYNGDKSKVLGSVKVTRSP